MKKPRNNKKAGNRYELENIHLLKDLGFYAKSTREESRSLDAQKVDIVTDAPFYFQCKLTQNMPNLKENFSAMPKDKTPVLIHGKTEKKGERFYVIQ